MLFFFFKTQSMWKCILLCLQFWNEKIACISRFHFRFHHIHVLDVNTDLCGWVGSTWSAEMCTHQCGAPPSGSNSEVPWVNQSSSWLHLECTLLTPSLWSDSAYSPPSFHTENQKKSFHSWVVLNVTKDAPCVPSLLLFQSAIHGLKTGHFYLF